MQALPCDMRLLKTLPREVGAAFGALKSTILTQAIELTARQAIEALKRAKFLEGELPLTAGTSMTAEHDWTLAGETLNSITH